MNEARAKSIEFHNKALQHVKSDLQLAYRLLCSATVVDPDMAVAWYAMGNALSDLKMLPAAITAFRRCLECQIGEELGDLTPELRVKAMVNLGHRLVNDGRIEEAVEVTRSAIEMLEADPALDQEGRAFAWTNMSLALSIQGRDGEAIEYAKMAFAMSQEPIIETGLGFALLFGGEYAEGLRHFEARFPYRVPQFMNMPYQKWQGEKTGALLVEADQGAGDTLSYARFIPGAARLAKKLIFRVQPEILRMMTLAFAGLGNVEVVPQSPTFPIADHWCPVVSLPVALELTTEQIREQRQVWQMPPSRSEAPAGWKVSGFRRHIAIAHAGSPMNDIDQYRSIPITEFLALYSVPGVQLYSVQIGDRVRDLHEAGCASLIRDMSPWIKDALDTVAILREVDLVIACESFVAHLAAAAGLECWVPLSYLGGDYRCGRSGDRPLWYPKTRLFRQGPDATWGPVFARIVEALSERPRQ